MSMQIKRLFDDNVAAKMSEVQRQSAIETLQSEEVRALALSEFIDAAKDNEELWNVIGKMKVGEFAEYGRKKQARARNGRSEDGALAAEIMAVFQSRPSEDLAVAEI